MKTKKTPTRDDYLELVKGFPLRKIRTATENRAALEALRPLIGRDGPLTDGESDYVDALAVLVAEYERGALAHRQKPTPAELLGHLMAERGLTVGDIAAVVGSKSAASMIVNAKREPSKVQAKRLAGHFKLDVGAFI